MNEGWLREEALALQATNEVNATGNSLEMDRAAQRRRRMAYDLQSGALAIIHGSAANARDFEEGRLGRVRTWRWI
jgi:hypothetical protein